MQMDVIIIFKGLIFFLFSLLLCSYVYIIAYSPTIRNDHPSAYIVKSDMGIHLRNYIISNISNIIFYYILYIICVVLVCVCVLCVHEYTVTSFILIIFLHHGRFFIAFSSQYQKTPRL